jgi:hypothetical protein
LSFCNFSVDHCVVCSLNCITPVCNIGTNVVFPEKSYLTFFITCYRCRKVFHENKLHYICYNFDSNITPWRDMRYLIFRYMYNILDTLKICKVAYYFG